MVNKTGSRFTWSRVVGALLEDSPPSCSQRIKPLLTISDFLRRPPRSFCLFENHVVVLNGGLFNSCKYRCLLCRYFCLFLSLFIYSFCIFLPFWQQKQKIKEFKKKKGWWNNEARGEKAFLYLLFSLSSYVQLSGPTSFITTWTRYVFMEKYKHRFLLLYRERSGGRFGSAPSYDIRSEIIFLSSDQKYSSSLCFGRSCVDSSSDRHIFESVKSSTRLISLREDYGKFRI